MFGETSLQMCAELRHCQRWVTNRERQRIIYIFIRSERAA